MLQEAAEQLRRLSAPLDLDIPSVPEVAMQACNFWGRVTDPGPALTWAQKKTFQAAKVAIQNSLGIRADALATKMEACAQGIQRLQEKIRDLSQQLRLRQQTGDTLPQEAWLLNPDDIQGLLTEQPEDIARRGADEIADRLAAEINLNILQSPQGAFPDQTLSYWLISALERALETRIRRPADNVQRIKQRMTQCEPLARIITEGPELHKVMQDSQKSTPLKIVLTGLSEQERAELQRWAREENQKLGGIKMYEIHPVADELRDDILHLTFGWPLWLFDEIRTGEELLERAREQHPRRYQNSFLLGKQLPASTDHQIKPLSEEEARQWFGVALALRDVDFTAQEIVFRPERFPGIPPVPGRDLGERLDKAFNLFRQQGFTNQYRTLINGEADREPGAFRERLEDGLRSRLQNLEQARAGGQLPAEVYQRLRDFYQRARQYVDGIVIL